MNMTKNELAYNIGSQGLKPIVKKFFQTWLIAMFASAVLFIAILSSSTVALVKSKLIPGVRHKITEYESRPGKILTKSYSVQSASKQMGNFPILGYVIQSSDIKFSASTPIIVAVAYGFEDQFLKEVKSHSLVLEYHEGHMEKPLVVYPKRLLWPAILNEMESDYFLLYRLTIGGWFQDESTIHNLPKSEENVEFDPFNLLVLFLLPALPLYLFVLQEKRRSLFLNNFKKEDILRAEKCTIDKCNRSLNVFKKTSNVSPLYGQVYKVLNHENVFVVYNGSNSKQANGFLLKYEDHYFFIHEKWFADSKVKKAA
jgi:hypothetical protein